ncbi:hypothetical protein D0Z07_9072 [Hyphodiscus hymeniophilus]|uniref:Uncharacterized protein n=1 Tax=Hyphodiscus hymeniophilus TaxID=353542 RepID=A0A9P6SJS2_9HELO|nr:hypothetical protein D0Z07_9072 [Hyphodiscus hymeniophilus]
MISEVDSRILRFAFRIYLYVFLLDPMAPSQMSYFQAFNFLSTPDITASRMRSSDPPHSIGTLTLIGLIGSQCCKCAAKLDLLHGRTVNLHRMTGWLRPSDIATCIWKLRRLPGGLGLGLMMVVVSLVTLTADLAVNILVYPRPQQGFCGFDYGLVMNWTIGEEQFIQPPPNSYPARIASNAQIFSVSNGCPIGIYSKIPWSGNATFCANELDIMGTWDCEIFGSDYNFDGNADPYYIGDWLQNNTLQYDAWSSTEYSNKYGQSSHIVIWSSSTGFDPLGESFDVLASVDMNGTYDETKTMRTYQCKVVSNYTSDLDHIQSILKQMQSNDSLAAWKDGLEADLYLGDLSDIDYNVGQSIAQRLNSMTMVQGGSNFVDRTSLDYPFFGCIEYVTYISPAILALIGFTGFCLLTVAFYWIILFYRLGRHALPSFLHGEDTHTIKPVPDSILSWMLQASRENALGAQMAYGENAALAGVPRKERELHNWAFSVAEPGSHVARMVRIHGDAAPQMVEQVYMNLQQK